MSTTLLVNGVIMVTMLTEWFHRGQQKDLIPFKPFFINTSARTHTHITYMVSVWQNNFDRNWWRARKRGKSKMFSQKEQQERFDLTTIFMCWMAKNTVKSLLYPQPKYEFSLQKSIKHNNINDDSVTLSVVLPPSRGACACPLKPLISARDSNVDYYCYYAKQNKTKQNRTEIHYHL